MIEAEKNDDKDLTMNNAVYRKATENLRNRVDVRLVYNEKDYYKRTSKASYVAHLKTI